MARHPDRPVHRFDSLGRQVTLALDAASLRNELNSRFAYRTYVPAPPTLTEKGANQLDSPFRAILETEALRKRDMYRDLVCVRRWDLRCQIQWLCTRHV